MVRRVFNTSIQEGEAGGPLREASLSYTVSCQG